MPTFRPPGHLPRLSLLPWLAATLLAGSGAAAAAPDWDILGIRLGMSEAEVRAALRTYDAQARITARNASFQYSDQVRGHTTPPFLSQLEMRTSQKVGQNVLPQTFVRVWFSGVQAGEARAIAVMRDESNVPNPPSGPQFLQSLAGKYGQPSTTDRQNTPIWEQRGKPSCLWMSYGRNMPKEINHTLFSLNLVHRMDFGDSVAALERRQQGSGGEHGVDLPADLRQCGAFMVYLGTARSPAISFNAAMFDVGAIVATQRSRQAWVQQLEAEAVRRREGQAQSPRL